MSQRYVHVLAAAGAVPWVIPLLEGDEATLRAIYERLDGLFLPGGVDVDPSAYGEPRGPLCGRTDPARDWTELLFLRWALADRKPVLAVCRGAQLVNVAVGGSLYQDVAAQHPAAIKHDHFPVGGRRRDELAHEVHLVRQLVAPPTAHGKVVVLDRGRMLRRHILVQRAANRDIDELRAATDREHRLPVRKCPPQEQQLGPVARRIRPATQWAARLAIGGRIHVDAARQKQPVEPLIDRP